MISITFVHSSLLLRKEDIASPKESLLNWVFDDGYFKVSEVWVLDDRPTSLDIMGCTNITQFEVPNYPYYGCHSTKTPTRDWLSYISTSKETTSIPPPRMLKIHHTYFFNFSILSLCVFLSEVLVDGTSDLIVKIIGFDTNNWCTNLEN